MKIHKLTVSVIASALLLAGCSQRASDVNDTVKLALFGTPDVVKTAQEVRALPYASTYARIGDYNQIFMVLALAEHKYLQTNTNTNTNTNTHDNPLQLKWMSSDNGMLVTENGRIVKTFGLQDGNLLASNSTAPDPLWLNLTKKNTPTEWQRTISWQPGYHVGYQLTSKFTNLGSEIIDINGQPTNSVKFDESVTVKELNQTYHNTFWLNPTSGQVIKSIQYPAPGLPEIEMTLLKPFA
ncbi:TPA: YjbF family lipoprotein [Photobacterium damselae]